MTARRPLRDVAFLYLANGLSQGAVALTYLLSARASTSVAEFGSIALVVSAALLTAIVLDFGGGLFALRETTSGRWSVAVLRGWIRSKIVVFAVAAVGMAVFAGITTRDPVVAIAAGVFLLGTGAANVLALPLRAALRFDRVSLIQFTSRLLPALTLLTTSLLGLGATNGLVVALAAGTLIESVGYRVAWGVLPSPTAWPNPFRGTFRIGVNTAPSALGNLDIALVTAAAGARAAGEYAAVNRWANALGLVSTAVTQAYFPRLAAAPVEQRGAVLVGMVKPIVLFMPVLALVAALADPICRILLGDAFAGAAPVLAVLAAAVGVSMFCNAINTALLAWGFETIATACTLTGLAVQIAGQYGFSRLLGAAGAPVGSLVGQIVSVIGLGAALVWIQRREARLAPSAVV